MTKRSVTFSLRVLYVLLALAMALSMAGCSASQPTPAPKPTPTSTPQPIDLVVLHTNDVVGYTDPCGWRPPKGGLARRASVIKATRSESAHVLLLDAGNALWSNQPLAEQSQGKVIIDAMNLMGYDAMAIGDLDLQLGPEVLRQRIAEAKFPILSANVTLASDGKLLAQPYTLREVGGRKIGIIGLTWDATQPTSAATPQPFVLLKADDVLAKYVAELGKQTDIIIVLSNMGHDEDVRLSSLVPGIDLIVGSRSRLPLSEAFHNEQTGTYIVQAGSQGAWIGRRHLHLDSGGAVTGYSDELLYLTDAYADDPELRAFLDNYKVQ